MRTAVWDTGRRFFVFDLHQLDHEWRVIMQNETLECLECAADITLPDDVMANEIIACPECGVELEVISLEPVELDYAPEVEEDWGE